MKKVISVILIILLLLSLNGCRDANQWGVSLKTKNVTSKGLTIVCRQSGGENVAELTTGMDYIVQEKLDSTWKEVDYVIEGPGPDWPLTGLIISKNDTTTWEIDWETIYGELPVGEYRIGKEIMNFRGAGDYDLEMVYAEFIIE